MADQSIGGWNEVSRREYIANFFNLTKNDVRLLEHIDELPFVDTPLHISAIDGDIEFSIEMMKLKPSFISKQNVGGHTPINLALLNGHTKMVRQLLQHNVDLVRVKGRECMTPLHDAASKIGRGDPNHPHYEAITNDYLALLEIFLSVCPVSITDLTIRNETALHIALRNNNLKAFKFLVGWLLRKWPDWRKILEQKDVKGNTVLHIAALEIQTSEIQTSEIQTQAVNHILDLGKTFFNINEKNFDNKTALDILLEGRQGQDITDMRLRLERAGAVTADSLPTVTPSHEHYQELPGCFRRNKINFFGNQVRRRIPDEKHNALLVVAALLVTVTYQAAITPPGGLWQDDLFEANTTDVLRRSPDDLFKLNITAPHRAGSATARGTFPFSIFIAFNSIIFLSSIITMVVLVPPDDVVGVILAGVSVFLYFGYFSSLMIITQAPDWLARIVLFSPVIISAVGYAFFIAGKDRFDSHES